jgi:hypothetical protein
MATGSFGGHRLRTKALNPNGLTFSVEPESASPWCSRLTMRTCNESCARPSARPAREYISTVTCLRDQLCHADWAATAMGIRPRLLFWFAPKDSRTRV